jgi:cytochrome c-type biogenesis protein CcmH
MKRIFPITFLTLILALAFSSVAFAQGGAPTDDDVNAIAKQLFCPVCENTPLDVCPTQACAQWRDLIREKLTAGWTEQQIKDYFVTQYGARVLSEPPRTGLNWLVYLVPPVIFLVGAYILYRALQSMRKPAAAVAETAAPVETESADDYLKRVEEELKKRK